MADEQPSAACVCETPVALYTCFEATPLGWDPTDGRYAEVRLLRCLTCNRLWLQYRVEYEAFSSSGRWARGLISPEDAAAMIPEKAADHLHGLPSYLYGGSYFDGEPGTRSGKMYWGP